MAWLLLFALFLYLFFFFFPAAANRSYVERIVVVSRNFVMRMVACQMAASSASLWSRWLRRECAVRIVCGHKLGVGVGAHLRIVYP